MSKIKITLTKSPVSYTHLDVYKRQILNVAVRFGLKSSPTNPLLRNRLKPVWVPVKVLLSTGWQWLNPAE